MSKPIVAIVGRPNVGKSTLFNVLAGEKISIVQDTPGVTRDRIYADINWLDYNFTLIDTGGIEPESDNIILKSMREQAEIALPLLYTAQDLDDCVFPVGLLVSAPPSGLSSDCAHKRAVFALFFASSKTR